MEELLKEVQEIYPEAKMDENNEVFLCDINDGDDYLSLCIEGLRKTEYNLYVNNIKHDTYSRITTTKNFNKILDVLKAIKKCEE